LYTRVGGEFLPLESCESFVSELVQEMIVKAQALIFHGTIHCPQQSTRLCSIWLVSACHLQGFGFRVNPKPCLSPLK
jgi:hypothetical protein